VLKGKQVMIEVKYDEMDEIDEIEELIDRELRPRLKAFGRDIELLGFSKDGTVSVSIRKIEASLFIIMKEVLEKIVTSRIKLCLPRVRKVVIKWD
jgi:hypothetical protein